MHGQPHIRLLNELITNLQLPKPKICTHVYSKANVLTGLYGDVHLCHDRTRYTEISINIRFWRTVLEVYLRVVTILLLWQIECELVVNCEIIWKIYIYIHYTTCYQQIKHLRWLIQWDGLKNYRGSPTLQGIAALYSTITFITSLVLGAWTPKKPGLSTACVKLCECKSVFCIKRDGGTSIEQLSSCDYSNKTVRLYFYETAELLSLTVSLQQALLLLILSQATCTSLYMKQYVTMKEQNWCPQLSVSRHYGTKIFHSFNDS